MAKNKNNTGLKQAIEAKLLHNFSVQPEAATDENYYNALVLVLRDRMREMRVKYISQAKRSTAKVILGTSPDQNPVSVFIFPIKHHG